MFADTAASYDKCVLRNYAPAALTLVRGEGARVWDDSGKCYLDFCSGIATNSLGHAHPRWVAAIAAQAGRLAHVSNLFRNETQARLATRLAAKAADTPAGAGRLFFCNSGAEANEALLKLSRLHGKHRRGIGGRLLVARNAFHGRTFGAMSATPQEKIQKGFFPLLPGVDVAVFNDVASFEKLMGPDVDAVLVEPVQGESGLAVATPEFLRGLRTLCDQHGALLLFDEVQTGVARTGKFLAFEHFGVAPDAFSLAKGLGGGFPIGAAWVAERHAGLFVPGSHGTTFGGNPLACAAANAVLDVVEQEGVLGAIDRNSAVWLAELGALARRFPGHIREIRGLGYLRGVAFHTPSADVHALLRANGLLTVPAGDNVLRLLPPLTVGADILSEAASILAMTLEKL
ncbi:MAG: aspartate aminotransferase family protein [Puniceicoccales bacterium]|jgi:acetylornithine aminotransferase/acetylornithine/N-succinyldiaminopimelate aminotransferase|nr:aspartate aminotransferase family protein [Puniceicoccales bacterium]